MLLHRKKALVLYNTANRLAALVTAYRKAAMKHHPVCYLLAVLICYFLLARLHSCKAYLRSLVSYVPHQSAVLWQLKCFEVRTPDWHAGGPCQAAVYTSVHGWAAGQKSRQPGALR